ARSRQKSFPLLGGEPISHPYTQPSYSLHPADASSQFRAQQAGIGSLVSNSPDSRETQVDRRRRVSFLFEVDSVSEDHSAVEGKTWFRTVPLHKFSDRMIVRSLAAFRGERVQNSEFRLFKVWKSENAFWRFLFLSRFRHGRRPPQPSSMTVS